MILFKIRSRITESSARFCDYIRDRKGDPIVVDATTSCNDGTMVEHCNVARNIARGEDGQLFSRQRHTRPQAACRIEGCEICAVVQPTQRGEESSAARETARRGLAGGEKPHGREGSGTVFLSGNERSQKSHQTVKPGKGLRESLTFLVGVFLFFLFSRFF